MYHRFLLLAKEKTTFLRYAVEPVAPRFGTVVIWTVTPRTDGGETVVVVVELLLVVGVASGGDTFLPVLPANVRLARDPRVCILCWYLECTGSINDTSSCTL